jgi:hypothetical protein
MNFENLTSEDRQKTYKYVDTLLTGETYERLVE